MLGIGQRRIPRLLVEPREVERRGRLAINRLRATSWPGVCAAGVLYRPDDASTPRPTVLLCCGHNRHGKLNETYQRMAIHLARAGAAVLVIDCIGQGERQPMGHRDLFDVFACGMTVQGLIAMEAIGWLEWLQEQSWVDPARIAAIGNSGGGAATMTLCALRRELACIVSSGYPGRQEFTCHKERALCSCTIWPGVAGRLEMWELLASFAPGKLLIFQGDGDPMFPADDFTRVARQVTAAYRYAGAPDGIEARLVEGGHAWDDRRILLVGEVLGKWLGLAPSSAAPVEADPTLLAPDETCFRPWPTDAASGEQLARRLTGHTGPVARALWDVFPADIPVDQIAQVTGPHDTRRVLSQMAAFLHRPAPVRPRADVASDGG